MTHEHNWAGNIAFGASRYEAPDHLEGIAAAVSEHHRVRVVGAAHSFNDIAATDGVQLDLHKLNRVLAIDSDAMTVTVEGGIRYHELCSALHERGLALANLMSIPHFSVAGATATGTHGSGDALQSLAGSIRAMRLIDGTGDLRTVGAGDPLLDATATALGALGVIVELTLAVEPAYDVAQEVIVDLPLRRVIDELDDIMASAYSVSLFTDWQGDTVNQLWRKHRCDDPSTPREPKPVFGGRLPGIQLAPTGVEGAPLMTPQLLQPGPWHERMTHVHPRKELARGLELQTEYFVDRRRGREALDAVAAIGPELAPVIKMAEIRTVASDRIWLSPFPVDSLALHFSWLTEPGAVHAILPTVEAALEPFAPRPHWGKLHRLDADRVRGAYPRWTDFVALCDRWDPEARFRNSYLDDLLRRS